MEAVHTDKYEPFHLNEHSMQTRGVSRVGPVIVVVAMLIVAGLVVTFGFGIVPGLLGGSHTASSITSQSQPNLINIHSHYSGVPAAIGIADYGVEGQTPYEELMNGVEGTTTVYSLGAHNASLAYPYSSDLQMNVVLQINTTVGSLEYWLQNVATFYNTTQLKTLNVAFGDEVWNYTLDPSTPLNALQISGDGSVKPSGNDNFYGAETRFEYPYLFPLKFNLLTTIQNISQNSVRLNFAYQVVSGGENLPTSVAQYDNVTINTENPIVGASIVVSGYRMTPSLAEGLLIYPGSFYDTELVWTGPGASSVTTFTSMNSTLSLSYFLANGGTTQPKSVYEFGSDTTEGTYNLQTTYANGTFWVTTGTPDFNENFVIS